MRDLVMACLVGFGALISAGCGSGGGNTSGSGANGGGGAGANGGSNAGGSNAGGSNAGGSNAGGSNAGGSNAGGSNAGGSSSGGSNAGGSSAGGSTSTLMGCADADRTGKVTYYNEANGSGACSFDPSPNDLMIGAMNAPDYMDSAACGACAVIHTQDGKKSVTVRIVDLCPECQTGHIDLSPQAFQQLGDLALGVIPTTWHYVSCDYQGPIQYKFKEGSNQWWTAVQIRHHSNRIAKFEYDKGGGNWVSVTRTSYNYFVEDKGMGPGPYHFRVTDVFGQTVEDEGIPFGDGAVADGKANFPPCAQ